MLKQPSALYTIITYFLLVFKTFFLAFMILDSLRGVHPFYFNFPHKGSKLFVTAWFTKQTELAKDETV